MNRITSCILLAVIMILPASAAPMVSLGDNVNLFFNGSAGLRYESNVALDEENELDDFIFRFTPGIEVAIGKRGTTPANITVIFREEILRYNDNDRLDTEKFSAQLNGSFDDPKLSGKFDLGFREQQSNTPEANIVADLVESDVTTAGASVEYNFSPKLSFGGGFAYRELEYVTFTQLADTESLTIPLNAYYEISPKLDATGGVRWRFSDIEGGSDPDDLFVNVGLRGDLAPKVTGEIRVGFQEREFTARPIADEDGLSIEGNATWAATPKVQVRGLIARDFTISGTGETIEKTDLLASGNYVYNELISFTGSLGYTNSDYNVSGREDDIILFSTGVQYKPNDYVSLNAQYRFSDNDSSRAGSSYTAHVLRFSAALRY
ncbi:MAG: outer membrane beta-barrel protein [Opitutales bacterium]